MTIPRRLQRRGSSLYGGPGLPTAGAVELTAGARVDATGMVGTAAFYEIPAPFELTLPGAV